jgi:hypothetical protein
MAPRFPDHAGAWFIAFNAFFEHIGLIIRSVMAAMISEYGKRGAATKS